MSLSPALSNLFLWSSVNIARLHRIVLLNMEVGWASMFSGTWKFFQGIGSIAIVDDLQRGERASLCYNWNPTSSSANTLCLERSVPIFTSHMWSGHILCDYDTMQYTLTWNDIPSIQSWFFWGEISNIK